MDKDLYKAKRAREELSATSRDKPCNDWVSRMAQEGKALATVP